MELEEMKNTWENMEGRQKPIPNKINQFSRIEFHKKISTFRKGEIIGLFFAYVFAGFLLYKFNTLDTWYLRLCGIILISYLLTMPIYTLFGIWKMKHIDLAASSYKTLLEHIYTIKNNLKKAELISFAATPMLFVASIFLLTKLILNKNLLSLNIQYPVIILIGIAFLSSILFNMWAFKKRDKQFKSVKQLLEEDN